MQQYLYSIVLFVQVACAIGVVVLVLMQHGKGADMGASLGSGASGSLFGASGSANFLSRLTAWLTGFFFCTTLGLAFLAKGVRGPVSAPESIMEQTTPGASTSAPTAPASTVPANPATPPASPLTPPASGAAPSAVTPAAPAAIPASPAAPANSMTPPATPAPAEPAKK